MGPIWQAQLGENLVMLIGLSWAPKFLALLETKVGAHYGKKMFALTLPKRLANLCSAFRATSGQRQIRQSPGLALSADLGND